jgi:hypothetical protein
MSAQVLLLGLLFVVLLQSRTAGYWIQASRPVSSTVVFLLLMGFCVLARDPREYSVLQWVALGSLATVLGIFFYHGLAINEVSGMARVPFWYGVIMAVGVVVLPQYVSRRAFLWAVNRFAAVLVLVTLPVYVFGEYSMFGMPFRFHGAYTLPIIEYEVRAVRSLFVHRNAFGVVAFAGTVAAFGELHRVVVGGRAVWTVFVPSALLAIDASGLILSSGRALWVVTPMAIGVYLAYLVVGRRIVPLAILGAFAYLVAGIAAVHSGLIPLPEGTPTRAPRWYPTVAALLDNPSILGAGFVDPGEFIAPYQGTMHSPHNSYLTIAIRAGFLGGVVYVLLVVASLLGGVLKTLEAEGDASRGITLVALAVGFAAHQQFEAYTLFNWGSSTVLAVFVFGFLLFGERSQSGDPADT